MRRFLQVLLCTLVAFVTMGCGSSDNGDVLVLGGAEPGATTGNLVFNFVRAQTTVPSNTVELKFEFFNSGGVVLESETRPFAAQIVFTGVSSEVVRVEVTAITADGLPIASGEQPLVITGGEQEVTLVLNGVTLSSLTAEPATVTLIGTGTQQISIQGGFSNGELMFLDAADGQYSSNNTAVATVSTGGLITGVSAGTTTINVGFVHEGQTTNATGITVTVVGSTLNLSGNNTFDTTTGLLNGATTNSWDGTRLSTEGFNLQAGATLNVTGTAAFQLVATGDVTVEGLIDASGSNGIDPGGNNPNSAAGALGGPGGFDGGRSAGADVGDPNGANGAGPGGGGGGQGITTDALDTAAGGGGGGHAQAGSAGTLTGTGPVAGLGGLSYVSIPTTLIGGSGGGGASIEPDSTGLNNDDDAGGSGGGGGGVVSLQAGGTLTVSGTGTINCSGGAGGNNGSSGGGGGGAGGSILLRAPSNPTVNGTLNVSGGAGGIGSIGANGGAGAVGRTDIGTL